MIRRIILVLGLVMGLASFAWANQAQDQQNEIRDVLRLVEQGIPDDLIVKHIQARGFVYDLSADDILELRDRGVSEKIMEAMVDTAITTPSTTTPPTSGGASSDSVQSSLQDPLPDDEVGDYVRPTSHTTISLSAGYFSPWYQYPAAWGFYYDPFPACYSAYYYPFTFYASWGWYGGCNYWYPYHWASYRWNDPWYWNYASAHHGWRVPVPVPAGSPPERWPAGRGLPDRRGPYAGRANAPVPGSHDGQPATDPHVGNASPGPDPVVHHPSRGGSRYATRMQGNRVDMQSMPRGGQRVGSPAWGTAAVRPYFGRRYGTGGMIRSNGAPHYSVPAGAPRSFGGSRASAPRFWSGGGGMAHVSMPRASAPAAGRMPMGGVHLR